MDVPCVVISPLWGKVDCQAASPGANVADMEFQHVDVFAETPFTGNSLTVFLANGMVTTGQMLSITREFRHRAA
jgi:hypothetical protein